MLQSDYLYKKKDLKKRTIIPVIFTLLCFASIKTYAQLESHLIANEAWLKGNFVEIGVNSKGVFGSNTLNAPPNFHDNREDSNNLFGFIANPKMDGWIDYDGDFFTPGQPEEGFTIEIDGINYSNNNTDNTENILGQIIDVDIVESDCFEDTARIRWTGTIDNVQINRDYSITENGLFIQMITRITNISSEVKQDVYFMHNLDPDNNVTLTGIFATDLEVLSQPSAANNISLVNASQTPSTPTTQDADGSSISFYANDERARVTYGNFSNRNASNVWNGSPGLGFESTVGPVINSDLAISIAFRLNDIQPNETKTFVYYYILEEIDDTFVPLIVNITTTSPTSCGGNEGEILLSGLTAGEDYIISYEKDGVLVPAMTYTANALGNIVFTGLSAGSYTNFSIEYASCTTNLDTVYELSDPLSPTFTVDKIDPSNCEGDDGSLVLSGFIAGEDVILSYTLNGVLVPEFTLTPDTSGEIVIPNLVNGDYSNFDARYGLIGCSTILTDIVTLDGTFPFTIDTIPAQFYCDSDLDFVTNIDFSSLDAFVLGSLPSSEYEVTYHDSSDNAMNNIQISKTNYETTGDPTYNIFVRVENITSGCFEIGSFPITVDIPSDFEFNDDFLCLLPDGSNDPDFNLPIALGLDETLHTFEWFYNNTSIANTTSSFIIENTGTYRVTVTTISTGCTLTKELEIFPSAKPSSVDVTLESDLFSDIHVVRVNAVGLGDYEYRLDNGNYQSSPVFEDVPAGDHLFYINDINGCGEVVVDKLIIDYPRFFTPNEDGVNDRWQIVGINALREPLIHIVNRYGKTLKIMDKNDIGWDGTYGGKMLPRNDYWFVLYYTDESGARKKIQANFTLIR